VIVSSKLLTYTLSSVLIGIMQHSVSCKSYEVNSSLDHRRQLEFVKFLSQLQL